MKSRLVKIAGILSIVLAAMVAGYLWLGHTNTADLRLAESVNRSQYVFERYLGDEDGSAKHAMLEHIEYLDKLSRESGNGTRNPYASDAMLWCVRLAKIEEREKGSNAAEYLSEAAARCQRLGWADCSEASLRHKVERMDSVAIARLKK